MISRAELLEDLNRWEREQNESNPGNKASHSKAKDDIIICYGQRDTSL